MLFKNLEFFCHEEEIWYRKDGSMSQLMQDDHDMINYIVENISLFYPKAYQALCEEYKGCTQNLPYFRFRVASRFIRCNFAELDNIPDITTGFKCAFEYISCPLRGECRYDRVICRPEFDHKLSPAESRVMSLVYDGLPEDEIGARLCLSPHTVHNHIRNAYNRINVHSKAEFIKYASDNKLF